MRKRTFLSLSVVMVLVGVFSPVPRVHGAFIRGDVDASGKVNLVDHFAMRENVPLFRSYPEHRLHLAGVALGIAGVGLVARRRRN